MRKAYNDFFAKNFLFLMLVAIFYSNFAKAESLQKNLILNDVRIKNSSNNVLHKKAWECLTNSGIEKDVDPSEKTKPEDIGIDLYDLNGDGKKEIFAFYPFRPLCNAFGECGLEVFSENIDECRKFLSVQGNPSALKILSSKTMDYQDLQLSTSSEKIRRLKWDGYKYKTEE